MVNKVYCIEQPETHISLWKKYSNSELKNLQKSSGGTTSNSNNIGKNVSTFLPTSSKSYLKSNNVTATTTTANQDFENDQFHKTIQIDPYPKIKSRFTENVTMIFNGEPPGILDNNNIKCTTGQQKRHHHHQHHNNNYHNENQQHQQQHNVEQKDLAINEIGRFQYILQMDREMGAHPNSNDRLHSTTSTSLSDHSTIDNIDIWRSNTTSSSLNESKFTTWCRKMKPNCRRFSIIWPVIILLAFILLGCLIFMFMTNGIKENNLEKDFLNSNFSLDHIINDNRLDELERDEAEGGTLDEEEEEIGFIDETHTKLTNNDDVDNVDDEINFEIPTTSKELLTTIQVTEKLIPIQNETQRIILKPIIEYPQKTVLKSIFGPHDDNLKVIQLTPDHHNFGIPIEEIFKDNISFRMERNETTSTTTESIMPKVSPTIPMSSSTTELSASTTNKDLGFCVSASLGICQGILQYDLTTTKSKRNLDSIELEHFQYLFSSQCSKRAPEFVCSALEPECLEHTLQPCKRICKSILEPCASIIASSEVLTTIFDCDQYPDSNDRNDCEDPTRRSPCNSDEFKCFDTTCIPKQWQCDNIKDCTLGEDEDECTFCDHEEFRCKTTHECIPEKYICDDYTDCADGSDENDCYQFDEETTNDYSRIHSFASILAPNDHTHNNKSMLTIFDYDKDANFTELMSKETNDDEIQKGEESGRVVVKIPTNLANFKESKEIMMTSDSENDFKYSISTSTTKIPSSLCPDDKLRCVSGKCITVEQLCDKVIDCPDGADETMCTYKN